MALMLIIVGACLALGGALGLLSGFDHMTTERGAATTIAGVTALVGGVISIGLGCVVARLTQILAAYEDDSDERIAVAVSNIEAAPASSAASASDLPAASESVAKGLRPEDDTLLRNPLTPRDTTPPAMEPSGRKSSAGRLLERLGRNKDTLAAGAAAGAAMAGTAALAEAKVSPTAEEPLPAAAPDQLDLAALITPAQNQPSATSPITPEAREEALQTAGMPERTDLLSDADRLELELANALKEDLRETAAPDTDAPIEPLPVVKSTRGRRKFSEMLEAKGPDAPPEPSPAEPAPEAPEPPAAAEFPDLEPANPEEQGRPEGVSNEEAEGAAETATVAAEQLPPTPAILGRYVRDGHTYTLYADGSVEALTDDGLKKYGSMEELRRDLTKA